MNVMAGTSGFSYKEWKGPFYPEDLPASRMLAWYADQLPAVEINNTFYRMPSPSVLESWADQVGENFRFVLKASRRITHFKRLKDVEDEVDFFLRSAASLGDRLGAVLFQLPPNMKKDVDRLEALLGQLGDPSRAAFEFRHESWTDPEVIACLTNHGATLCAADTEERPADIVPTGSLGYLRLRQPGYDEGELERWVSAVRGAGWDRAFVFFKHEDEGAGPLMARKFQQLVDNA
ncbi:MAG: DUF72 domain-containing protein [Gemmatimonadota bacterium]|nr:DUF72 domain-containing protein [Gemmatimonadota bacterium]